MAPSACELWNREIVVKRREVNIMLESFIYPYFDSAKLINKSVWQTEEDKIAKYMV